MKKRILRMLMAVAVGLGLLTGGIWGLSKALGEREVRYRGRSQYYWGEQLQSRAPGASNEAILVLNEEILPQLTRTMLGDTNDSRWRITLIEGLNELPGIQIYFRTADGRRAGAAGGIGDFGPPAAAAIPALTQALQGPDLAVRGPAAVSLGRLHAQPEEIIPLLIKYLDQEELREDAASALAEYGSLATAALPKLLPLFMVQEKDLHRAVIEAFRHIDPTGATEAKAKAMAAPAPARGAETK